jgi:glucose-6-phosphate 1-epimerase
VRTEEVEARFGIPGALRFEDGQGGLVRGAIATAQAQAEIYLHGAQIASWTPAGHTPALFLSPKAVFAAGKPIRGGVPIVFPWFGPPADGKPGPMHGFARTSVWEVESTRMRGDGAVELALTLVTERFAVRFVAAIGHSLAMSLEIKNQSESEARFEEALHTYLAVGDAAQISIEGLGGAEYIDKTDGFARKHQEQTLLRITGETDSVYLNTAAECVVHDPAGSRAVKIGKSGSASTVVWNPWSDKSGSFPDLGPDEWRKFVCVETANVGENAVVLPPGGVHAMTANICC